MRLKKGKHKDLERYFKYNRSNITDHQSQERITCQVKLASHTSYYEKRIKEHSLDEANCHRLKNNLPKDKVNKQKASQKL